MIETINQRLTDLFQNSTIWAFFKFIQTPQGKQIVGSSPHQLQSNKKTFIFQVTGLREACPELGKSKFLVISYFKQIGMKAQLVKRDAQGRRIWSVYHPDLGWNSTKAQVMDVWIKGQIQFFLRTESIVSKLYNELQRNSRMVRWNEDGNILEVNPFWLPQIRNKAHCMVNYGFYKANDDGYVNKYLNKQSTVCAWLLVHMEMRYKRRIQYFTRKEFRQQEKLKIEQDVKKQFIDDQSNILQEVFGNKEQKEKVFLQDKKQQERNQDMSKSAVELIKNKSMEAKSILINLQCKNSELELGPLFTIIDEMIRISKKQQQESLERNSNGDQNQMVIQELCDKISQLQQRINVLQQQKSNIKGRKNKSN